MRTSLFDSSLVPDPSKKQRDLDERRKNWVTQQYVPPRQREIDEAIARWHATDSHFWKPDAPR